MISRRRFGQWLAGAPFAAVLAARASTAMQPTRRVRVAAVQMSPRLADVAANLAQAERLIREAQRRGAEWIALPELFSSAAAFHPDMLAAIRPLDGAPAQLLQRLAREGNSVIGGSFLAQRGDDAFNSLLLALPDGGLRRHDKDLPSFWENCVCRGGDDDGVLETPLGPVGAVLCWEMIRSQTARRLHGRVALVIGGSCWWTLPDDAAADHPLRRTNLDMLRQAPVELARMLGVPVVHGSHAGRFAGFYSPELPDVAYRSRYLGEAMVVDAKGSVLARRGADQGPGLALAEIELPARPSPSRAIPARFWLPPDMPRAWQASWERWLTTGDHYYRRVTRPYLALGEVREYTPPYLEG